MVRIERELSEFLGVKVDLLTEGSISPYLIEGIKKEAKVISAWEKMTRFTLATSSIFISEVRWVKSKQLLQT